MYHILGPATVARRYNWLACSHQTTQTSIFSLGFRMLEMLGSPQRLHRSMLWQVPSLPRGEAKVRSTSGVEWLLSWLRPEKLQKESSMDGISRLLLRFYPGYGEKRGLR